MEYKKWMHLVAIASLALFLIPVKQTVAEGVSSVQTDTRIEFIGKLKAAVIAARQYPKTEPAGIQGIPVVSFTYLNGAVSDIKVDKSGGYPLLDLAAKDAVKHAVYPNTPPHLKDVKLHIVVSVPFTFK